MPERVYPGYPRYTLVYRGFKAFLLPFIPGFVVPGVGISAQNCQKGGPWAGVELKTVRKMRNPQVTVLVRE